MAKYFTLSLLLLGSVLLLTTAKEQVHDLEALPSIAADYKVQAVQSNKYGYPYRIAPTLTPVIQSRSDNDENEDDLTSVPAQGKPYGTRITESSKENGTPAKKGLLKKSPYSSRRQDSSGAAPAGKRFRSYVQPKYRNFDELEADFQPRRMDIDIPYASPYEYTKLSRKPPVSPIDPYLTPSAAPGDTFYPIPKAKPYAPPSYGHGYDGPSYGAGKYDDSAPYSGRPYGGPSSSYSSGGPSSSYPSSGGPSSSYPSSGGPSSSYTSSGGPSSSYPSSGGPSSSYPSSGSKYGPHQEDYAIKSNEPITGSIRKRLLDYAGASDLYEGEPDYLRQITRNKYKYGNLANDYYSYGGPVHRDSYRDFPYVESKISLLKKAKRAL